MPFEWAHKAIAPAARWPRSWQPGNSGWQEGVPGSPQRPDHRHSHAQRPTHRGRAAVVPVDLQPLQEQLLAGGETLAHKVMQRLRRGVPALICVSSVPEHLSCGRVCGWGKQGSGRERGGTWETGDLGGTVLWNACMGRRQRPFWKVVTGQVGARKGQPLQPRKEEVPHPHTYAGVGQAWRQLLVPGRTPQRQEEAAYAEPGGVVRGLALAAHAAHERAQRRRQRLLLQRAALRTADPGVSQQLRHRGATRRVSDQAPRQEIAALGADLARSRQGAVLLHHLSAVGFQVGAGVE